MTLAFSNNHKISKPFLTGFDYFYLFVVVLYAAMATPATFSMVRPTGGVIAHAIPWILTTIFVLKHRIQFHHKNLVIVIMLYLFWIILQAFSIGIFYLGTMVIVGNILIAYILIRVYDFRMFFLYEKIVTFMGALSICFWLFHVFIPGAFTTFMKATSIYEFPPSHTIIANNFFYSLSGTIYDDLSLIPRNAGFSWEPGRYASMLLFALFFNVIRKNFDVLKNKSFWILVVALLTTQSTTGYVCLLLIIFMIIHNKDIKITVLATPFIILPLVIGLLSMPFMAKKISSLWFDPAKLEAIQIQVDYHMSVGNKELKVIPQRFDSITYHFMNFKDSPLLGYGVDITHSYTHRAVSPLIWPTGGIITMFSQFGIVIGVFCYFILYKSSVWFSTFFGYNGKWFLFSIFTLLSVSYSFWIVPIFMSLWMFPLFYSKHRN